MWYTAFVVYRPDDSGATEAMSYSIMNFVVAGDVVIVDVLCI